MKFDKQSKRWIVDLQGLDQIMGLESAYKEVIVLHTSGETESCKWNCRRLIKLMGMSLLKPAWTKNHTFVFVNICLIYVKCSAMTQNQTDLTDCLKQCLSAIKRLDYNFEQLRISESKLNINDSGFNPESLSFSEFRWVLSSLAIIASNFNYLGYQR